ncbi:MAG: hypothetical protein ACRCXZ_07460 [Patescibacteria group bacterium]
MSTGSDVYPKYLLLRPLMWQRSKGMHFSSPVLAVLGQYDQYQVVKSFSQYLDVVVHYCLMYNFIGVRLKPEDYELRVQFPKRLLHSKNLQMQDVTLLPGLKGRAADWDELPKSKVMFSICEEKFKDLVLGSSIPNELYTPKKGLPNWLNALTLGIFEPEVDPLDSLRLEEQKNDIMRQVVDGLKANNPNLRALPLDQASEIIADSETSKNGVQYEKPKFDPTEPVNHVTLENPSNDDFGLLYQLTDAFIQKERSEILRRFNNGEPLSDDQFKPSFPENLPLLGELSPLNQASDSQTTKSNFPDSFNPSQSYNQNDADEELILGDDEELIPNSNVVFNFNRDMKRAPSIGPTFDSSSTEPEFSPPPKQKQPSPPKFKSKRKKSPKGVFNGLAYLAAGAGVGAMLYMTGIGNLRRVEQPVQPPIAKTDLSNNQVIPEGDKDQLVVQFDQIVNQTTEQENSVCLDLNGQPKAEDYQLGTNSYWFKIDNAKFFDCKISGITRKTPSSISPPEVIREFKATNANEIKSLYNSSQNWYKQADR